MQMFQGFKPEGMKKIQQRMGYTGPADQFQSYLQANPDKQLMMNSYVNKGITTHISIIISSCLYRKTIGQRIYKVNTKSTFC